MHDRVPQVVRIAGWVEGLTLLLLLTVGVPAKHGFGEPGFSAVLGPVHGIAFLFYGWSLLQAYSADRLSGRLLWLGFLFAMIPGGSWFLWRRGQRPIQSDASGEPP